MLDTVHQVGETFKVEITPLGLQIVTTSMSLLAPASLHFFADTGSRDTWALTFLSGRTKSFTHASSGAEFRYPAEGLRNWNNSRVNSTFRPISFPIGLGGRLLRTSLKNYMG